MKCVLWNYGWTFTSDIDATAKIVHLPHDAMQTEKRIPGLKDGTQTGFYPGGKYTYEKELTVTAEEAEKTTLLEFEGIYMKSSVYLNGELVGGRIYGYSNFLVDLTGKLKVGRNTIKVVVDNSQHPNSRWYSGSGIYRDVWLHTAGDAYILPNGVRVTTESINPAQLRIRTDAITSGETEIRVRVSLAGKVVAEGTGADITLEIENAQLWSAETPVLYDVTAELVHGEEILDTHSDKTGIRSIVWDVSNGFQVNGQTTNLRGGCVHHDNGFIGAAEYDAACLRRIRIMKEAGFNAVRIAHNPASKAMLRACDTLGMYVMNESFDTWLGLKSPYDYAMYFRKEWEKDLTDMIRVSFNHPCVVMYCIGNEVYLKDLQRAAQITNDMVALCHKLDSSRPVTNAINPLMVIMGDSKNPEANTDAVVDPRAAGDASALTGSSFANVMISNLDKIMLVLANEGKMRKTNAAFEPLDIVGYNYGTYLYHKQHKDYPERVLVGSETFPKKIYENWQAVKSMPWLVGDFLWTAWDYLGECGVGMVHYGKQGSFTQPFPTVAAGCSNIDLTGEITPQGYFAAIVYGTYDKPYLAVHPLPHAGKKLFTGKWRLTDAVHSWDWPGYDGTIATVDVYSGAEQAELFLNGKSLGKKPLKECKATFAVPFAPGELKAVHYDSTGKEMGSDILHSAGSDVLLKLHPEKTELSAGGQDLLYLPIVLEDSNGIRKNMADREVTVTVEGAAVLAGLGNADLQQESLTPYTGCSIPTFGGRALAILRSTNEIGAVRVTVSAEGLAPVSAVLDSK